MSARAADDKWSAQRYNTNANFVYSDKFTNPVVEMLAPQPGEDILDLGCGSGELTLSSLLPAVLPSGSIVALDKSPSLLSKASSNLSSSSFSPTEREHIQWVEKDGHDVGELGTERFDAVFSNAALHWMKRDPAEVVRGVHKVLKKGGRYVAECGGALNMVGVRSMLHTVLASRGIDASALDPWYFPSSSAYQKLLEDAGFRVETCELVPRPTPLPTGLRGWLETFGFAFLDALPSPSDRDAVIDEVCRRLEVDMKPADDGDQWTTMYVRLRFKAWKD
ncbi:hypothetical protein JCM1840_005245 [Sporobolomyces johnsonii]